MNNHTNQSNRGFIALISSVIISVVLLLTITTLSFNGYYNRFNVFESEMKEKSRSLAEACINIALLKIVSSKNYTGNSVSTIRDSGDCYVGEIKHESDKFIFKTKAAYYNSQTSLEITVDDLDFSQKSVMEIAAF